MDVSQLFVLSGRWPGAGVTFPPDAGPAADSDEESTAPGSDSGRSCSPAESRAAAAGPGCRTAEGIHSTPTATVKSSATLATCSWSGYMWVRGDNHLYFSGQDPK